MNIPIIGKDIKIPYNGIRTTWFVYHPLKQWNQITAFNDSMKIMHDQIKSWYDIVELYEDEQTRSEKVISDEAKRDIKLLLADIEKTKDPYMVEALAEALFDKVNHDEEDESGKGRKTEKHYIPYFKELEHRAAELKAMDLGITVPSGHRVGEPIRRTFTG